jgi:hypothetical protein
MPHIFCAVANGVDVRMEGKNLRDPAGCPTLAVFRLEVPLDFGTAVSRLEVQDPKTSADGLALTGVVDVSPKALKENYIIQVFRNGQLAATPPKDTLQVK